MNILVIAHYQDDGSPYVSFVHSQVAEFIKQGHKVIVIVPTVFGKKYKYLNDRTNKKIDGAFVYYIDCLSFSNIGKYTVNNWCGYGAIALVLKKILRKNTIDIIHAHTIGFDGYIATRIKEKYHIPTVITTHGSDTMAEVKKGKEKYIIQICEKADYVVAVSTKLKNILLQKQSSLNIGVILNGFSCFSMPSRKKEPYTILQVGSLIKQKKTDITICAFAKLVKKYPQARLEIIGDGDDKTRLRKICKDLGVEESVHFCGFLENEKVLMHMAKSQIFVMPSINEGFGIVYIEAMSQKCVVIGTKGEGIEDVIEDGKNGILVSPNCIDELADHFVKCFSSLKYCDEIAENGFLTSQALTWENNAKKYVQLFNEIKRQYIDI